jgi:FdhD protein
LALRTAEVTGLTLVGIARDDGFEVFTHPERIIATDTFSSSASHYSTTIGRE